MKAAILPRMTFSIYLKCARRAAEGLRLNWHLMIAAPLCYSLAHWVGIYLSPLGFGGALISGLISVALLSIYFRWISETALRRKLKWVELVNFDVGLFSDTLSVAFLLYLIIWPFQLMQGASNEIWLLLCVKLGLVIVLNPVPEVIHQQRLDGISAILAAARFTRDNWIEWFLPLLLLAAPPLLIIPSYFLLVLASSEPLLPVLVIVRSWHFIGHAGSLMMVCAGLILGHWFMLFRTHLFNELAGGNHRIRSLLP